MQFVVVSVVAKKYESRQRVKRACRAVTGAAAAAANNVEAYGFQVGLARFKFKHTNEEQLKKIKDKYNYYILICVLSMVASKIMCSKASLQRELSSK